MELIGYQYTFDSHLFPILICPKLTRLLFSILYQLNLIVNIFLPHTVAKLAANYKEEKEKVRENVYENQMENYRSQKKNKKDITDIQLQNKFQLERYNSSAQQHQLACFCDQFFFLFLLSYLNLDVSIIIKASNLVLLN